MSYNGANRHESTEGISYCATLAETADLESACCSIDVGCLLPPSNQSHGDPWASRTGIYLRLSNHVYSASQHFQVATTCFLSRYVPPDVPPQVCLWSDVGTQWASQDYPRDCLEPHDFGWTSRVATGWPDGRNWTSQVPGNVGPVPLQSLGIPWYTKVYLFQTLPGVTLATIFGQGVCKRWISDDVQWYSVSIVHILPTFTQHIKGLRTGFPARNTSW